MSQARTADKYDLYQRSVQAPDNEVRFFDRVYQKAFKKKPAILREDFCGTFAVCCDWVKRGKDRRALGVDLDPEPLGWGRAHNLAQLNDQQQKRVQLLEADVRDRRGIKADLLAAQNFSFYIFTTRRELVEYFRAAYHNIAGRGLMVLDMMGGYEAMHEPNIETRRLGGFTYVWEHRRFDPISNQTTCLIHFRFPDGSRMENAFRYDWRLWTVPEVREALAEAGFSRTDVYWEGTDRDTGQGNGVFRVRKQAESDPAWIAYLVAHKG